MNRPTVSFQSVSTKIFQYWYLVLLVAGCGAVALVTAWRFSSLDEVFWLMAGQKFGAAIARGDWAGTYVGSISAHPGVTIEWISAAAAGLHALTGASATIWVRLLLFAAKLGLLGTTLWLLRRWLPGGILVVCGSLWLLHPLLFGTPATWLDQLLGLQLIVTLVSWRWWAEARQRRWLVITGVWFGLACLTKDVAILLLPLMMLLGWPRGWAAWRQLAIDIALVAAIGLAVFTLFYPAMWVHPLKTMVSRVATGAATSSGVTLAAPGSKAVSLLMYPYFIIIDPLLLLGSVSIGFAWAKRYYRRPDDQAAPLWLQLGTSGLAYVAMLSAIGLLFIDRGNGPLAFMAQRYLSPVVSLVTLTLVAGAWFWMPKRWFWVMAVALIGLELYGTNLVQLLVHHPIVYYH